MCFSTSASFGAGAILAVVGVITIKKVQLPRQVFFASFPIIFSIQQFTEGFVWITLSNNSAIHLQQIPIYIFAFFAQVIWPIWVPLAFYMIEKNIARKKILLLLLSIGLALSIYHLYCMLRYDVSAIINPYHIFYQLDFPRQHYLVLGCFYLLTIILPPFVSSIKKTSVLGILLLTSFAFSKILFNDVVISVWCFFAALVSIYVFYIMKNLEKNIQLSNFKNINDTF